MTEYSVYAVYIRRVGLPDDQFCVVHCLTPGYAAEVVRVLLDTSDSEVSEVWVKRETRFQQ